MDLFEKLGKAQGVQMLCGMTVELGIVRPGGRRQLAVAAVREGQQTGKARRPTDYVLLALHYYSQILSRYPRTESASYDRASALRQAVYHIIEEGIWPGSDLVRYARADGRMEVVPTVAEQHGTIRLALIRPLLGDDLDAAVELPEGVSEDEVGLSVIAVFQGLVAVLEPDCLELLDKSLRYLQSYHEEGTDWTEPGAVRNMPNRAFREAGGDAA
jgi:hypothetical protein